MSTPKNKTAIYGVKHDGVIDFYEFETPAHLRWARQRAKKLGLSLAQVIDNEKFPEPRKFTSKDAGRTKLEVKVTGVDDFTAACLQRQADYFEMTVEEYIAHSALECLWNDEMDALIDAATGKVALADDDYPRFLGCVVEEGAKRQPAGFLPRIPVPAGAIVEACN